MGPDPRVLSQLINLTRPSHLRQGTKSHLSDNVVVDQFNGTLLDEPFRVTMRDEFDNNVEALQADLDTWIFDYITDRLHLG